MSSSERDLNLSQLIGRTLEDLTTIRRSLLAVSESSLAADGLASLSLDLELAGQFKNVVDAVRLLLWAYTKALSASSERHAAGAFSRHKMELAVEMLRSVQPRVDGEPPAAPMPSRFEDLINCAMVAATRHPLAKNRTQ
jgi:hypothetical protein